MRKHPIISMIAAVAENYAIGRDGDLPWRLPSDLKWFKSQTVGKPVVMGRKTHESLGFVLPSRRNIVVTRNPDFNAKGCDVVHSFEDAIALVADADEVMILGGAGIYESCIDTADRFYLTVVHAHPEADTFFPVIDDEQWRVSFREWVDADERNPIDHTFYILEREHYGPAGKRSSEIPFALRAHSLTGEEE